jgi:hypothetical protein
MSRKISVAKTKTTTAKETLYTVPVKNTGLWQLAYVISTGGTNTPSVYWYDSSTTNEYVVLSGKNLGAGDFVLLSDAEVVLQEGDEIRISQSGTSSVTYIFTVELVPNQATQFHGG